MTLTRAVPCPEGINAENYTPTWGSINPLVLRFRKRQNSYPKFKIIEESRFGVAGNTDRALLNFFEKYKDKT